MNETHSNDANANNSLEKICSLRMKKLSNPLIGYLNINSLRNKIIDVREIFSKFSPDYFVFSETKLDDSFPISQFNIEGYEIRTRKDRDKNGGGLIEYVKKGVICKQMNHLCSMNNEIICSQLTIRNKKWIIVSAYRPPLYSNLINFFKDLENILNQALSKCDNIIVMGDLNINVQNYNDSDLHHLLSLCDIFCLKNLIKCFAGIQGSSIDVILTNKARPFQNTMVTETGLSDHHVMITTFLKAHLVRLKPKKIFYRNYRKFNEANFLNDVKNANFVCDTDNPEINYDNLVQVFGSIIEKHAPLKQKIVRGNEAPFMNKELKQAIYRRSRLKNKYNKEPTIENKNNYKKQRNKCVNLRKKAVKKYFKNIIESGIMENKLFWKTMKPFVTNKSGISNDNIMIVDNERLITDDKELARMLNDHYINIVEKSSGVKPNSIEAQNKQGVIDIIIKKFENHPSIIKIKESCTVTSEGFKFIEINEEDIENVFREININNQY